MHRLRLLPLLICFLAGSLLSANVNVYLRTEQTNKVLTSVKLAGRDYIGIDQINSLLGSISKQELTEQRIHFTFNSEQFIFLINSPYYSFKNQLYNMHYPLLRKEDKFYVPDQFLIESLPLHFPNNVSFKANTLSVLKPKNRSILRIVLDPGHGGKDPGAVGKNNTREKDINLGIALKLKQLLEKELGITVLMTRSDDRFVSLGNRTKFANDNKADLFISIHTNASQSSTANGVETYYLSTALNSDARAVEALENDVVEMYEGRGEKKKYDDLAFILSDLSQTEHLENSNTLAFYVQRNLVAGLRSPDRGVKQANFYVLRGAFMPSILMEVGFISHPTEETMLATKDYRDRLARTIFEGIKRYKYRYDRSRNI